MQRLSLLLGVVLMIAVVGPASACKYWCKNQDTAEYECCEEGNPYYELDEESSTPPEASAAPTGEEAEGAGSSCYYYCAYEGEIYCCGDDPSRIPESHEPHDGRCPQEDEQVCKNAGIYLVTKKAKLAKTSGSIQLVSGGGKEQPLCASDGYCEQDQKCCPSKCARRHICLRSLQDESEADVDQDKKQ